MVLAVLISVKTIFPAIAADTADDSIYINVIVDDYVLDYISDIMYLQQTGGDTFNQLKLDLIVSRSENKLPLVVFLMGVGFMILSKDGFLQQRMNVAEQGFVVVSIGYSSAPGATFPAPLIDAKAAIRYLKAYAEDVNIDKNKVAVWGCLAGGYLASMVGVTNGIKEFDEGDYLNKSSKVSCAIDMYGPSDLTMVGVGLGEDVEKSHARKIKINHKFNALKTASFVLGATGGFEMLILNGYSKLLFCQETHEQFCLLGG